MDVVGVFELMSSSGYSFLVSSTAQLLRPWKAPDWPSFEVKVFSTLSNAENIP